MKTGRDIKFVIYQILYIFVVCVIALKGADINLTEVLDRDLAETLKRERDSLIALGLVSPTQWDTAKKYSDADLELILKDYVKRDQNFADNKPQDGNTISNPVTGKGPNENFNETGSNVQQTEGTTIKKPVPPEFVQYTVNNVKNNYNKDLNVYGDGKIIASIKPQSSASIKINSEKEIRFEVEGISASTPTKEKQAPKIEIQKFISDGENASLRSLKGRVGYRVTVISANAGDLNINISGPVKIDKVGTMVYDITLNTPINSESGFDAWIKGKSEPFRESFTVTVKDKYNPKLSDSQMKTFTFGKW